VTQQSQLCHLVANPLSRALLESLAHPEQTADLSLRQKKEKIQRQAPGAV